MDIVDKLNAVDHMSVEDCFLQSPLFAQAAAEITRLRKERDEARAEYRRYEELRALLRNPNAVHANMLRGEIARPSVEQIRHIYQDALLSEATK